MQQILFSAAIFELLFACAFPFEPKVSSVPLEGDSVMSALPSLSTAMINRQETPYIKCLGRGADATFRQSDTGDISILLSPYWPIRPFIFFCII